MTDLAGLLLTFIVGAGAGVALARNGLSQMLRKKATSGQRLEFGGRIYTVIRVFTLLKRD